MNGQRGKLESKKQRRKNTLGGENVETQTIPVLGKDFFLKKNKKYQISNCKKKLIIFFLFSVAIRRAERFNVEFYNICTE